VLPILRRYHKDAILVASHLTNPNVPNIGFFHARSSNFTTAFFAGMAGFILLSPEVFDQVTSKPNVSRKPTVLAFRIYLGSAWSTLVLRSRTRETGS
jgi:hypothetical protein